MGIIEAVKESLKKRKSTSEKITQTVITLGIGNKTEVQVKCGKEVLTLISGMKTEICNSTRTILEGQKYLKNDLDSLLSCQIEKAVATVFKEKCKSIASKEVGSDEEKIVSKITEIDINLNRVLEDKGEQIKEEVKEYIESNSKATEDQLKQNLEVLRIENQKIFNYGEEILSVANKILESITKIEIAGEKNVEEFKNMIKGYFDLAEKRHQELVGIITKETGVTLSGNLDNNTILEMFNAIKQIKESAEQNKDDIEEYNKNILTIIHKQNKEIKTKLNKLKDIKKYAEEILSVDKEILSVVKENNRRITELLEKFNAELSGFNEKNDYICLTKQQIIEMEKTIKELNGQIGILQGKIETARRSGTKSFTPCPYCGVVPEGGRILSAEGNATCSTCGRPFKDTDPTIEENIVNRVADWRKKHTVVMNKTDIDNAYYMNFPNVELSDGNRSHACVSQKGIVIIPDKDVDGEKIKEINFCDVNSNLDREDIAKFTKAKYIFIKKGTKINYHTKIFNLTPEQHYEIFWYKWDKQDEIAIKKTEIDDKQKKLIKS